MPKHTAQRLVVLDLDDTLTIASRGLPRAIAAIADGLARLTKTPLARVKHMLYIAIERQKRLVERQPTRGVMIDGRIVAHAKGGALLSLFPPLRHVLGSVLGFEKNPAKQEGIIRLLIRLAYRESTLVWRSGAAELIETLYHERRRLPAYVVTESAVDSSRNKLAQLAPEPAPEWVQWAMRNARGDAGKMHIDDGWDYVPDQLVVPGMKRGVMLRRPRYFAALDQLRKQHGLPWDKVVAVGDNFEAELALPLAAGCRVVLLRKSGTLDCVADFVRSSPRGHVISGLPQLWPILGLKPSVKTAP